MTTLQKTVMIIEDEPEAAERGQRDGRKEGGSRRADAGVG